MGFMPRGNKAGKITWTNRNQSFFVQCETEREDYKLLDLCATALHHLSYAQKAYDARDINAGYFGESSEAQKSAVRAENARPYSEYCAGEQRGKPNLTAIRKIKATTAAGIYAKAMVVRASKTGAKLLAMSLAEDLIACPGLRESLWPAQKED